MLRNEMVLKIVRRRLKLVIVRHFSWNSAKAPKMFFKSVITTFSGPDEKDLHAALRSWWKGFLEKRKFASGPSNPAQPREIQSEFYRINVCAGWSGWKTAVSFAQSPIFFAPGWRRESARMARRIYGFLPVRVDCKNPDSARLIGPGWLRCLPGFRRCRLIREWLWRGLKKKDYKIMPIVIAGADMYTVPTQEAIPEKGG